MNPRCMCPYLVSSSFSLPFTENQDNNLFVMRQGDSIDNFEPLWLIASEVSQLSPRLVLTLASAMSSKDVPSIDTSKLKVAIKYGLCEMLNAVAIMRELAPKDGNFDFRVSDLEALFSEGMVDHNVDMVSKEYKLFCSDVTMGRVRRRLQRSCDLRREVSSKDGSVETGEYEVEYEVVLSHGQAGIRFSHDHVFIFKNLKLRTHH
ncbi:unnamed protein product [Eruca vesicaria subsp. sativa]|uniref:Uncharacterized protein n=1 Tax=Eruca vesicaria subsp. sativa TaxID=29727 RepID=A0ABC8LI22_ERUVS|nr:unnamed protein product [Eruca vesicaria subsp. sativa]